MRILLDHCVPRKLRTLFPGHAVRTTREMGWETLKNGKLLDAAQVEFDVLLTVDRNIPHQQDLTQRSIAVVIMEAPSNSPSDLFPVVPEVEKLLPRIQTGHYYTVRASRDTS